MTTRYIDLSVDQTGWEDCIIAVRNDFNDFSEQQIKVFPNPSDGIFEMSIAGFSSGQSLNLRVVDSQGRIILTRDERLWGEGLHNFRINLSEQSAGIYYIILMNNTNKVYSCKIIKK